ncbi:EPIDERMAL PATTERNING FACTOR-like protein [Vigna angularis]|uniref:Epidermal patterning factor-like protein n=3 Tax=Phaseolus angularis TaxID=3914 RepID=A0A8T0KP12_PHAAN|nr:EPIDERMAL PATTERNING FACTOR-like protein [Vigna angularis]
MAINRSVNGALSSRICHHMTESLSPDEKMGLTQVCVSCHNYRQTLLCLILFAILFTAKARPVSSSLIEPAQKDMKKPEPMMVEKSQIGSRPPKCERRCSTCEHCEAVQVPVAPQIQPHRSHFSPAKATTVVSYSSRGDDLSNYKPMSWKCKCGDYLFNP